MVASLVRCIAAKARYDGLEGKFPFKVAITSVKAQTETARVLFSYHK